MDFTEQAEQLVKLVRAYTSSHDDAVALIAQALKTAHSGGELQGFKDAHANAMRTLDRLVGGPQAEAVGNFAASGG